jgi:hypothetical protein
MQFRLGWRPSRCCTVPPPADPPPTPSRSACPAGTGFTRVSPNPPRPLPGWTAGRYNLSDTPAVLSATPRGDAGNRLGLPRFRCPDAFRPGPSTTLSTIGPLTCLDQTRLICI